MHKEGCRLLVFFFNVPGFFDAGGGVLVFKSLLDAFLVFSFRCLTKK